MNVLKATIYQLTFMYTDGMDIHMYLEGNVCKEIACVVYLFECAMVMNASKYNTGNVCRAV